MTIPVDEFVSESEDNEAEVNEESDDEVAVAHAEQISEAQNQIVGEKSGEQPNVNTESRGRGRRGAGSGQGRRGRGRGRRGRGRGRGTIQIENQEPGEDEGNVAQGNNPGQNQETKDRHKTQKT